MSRIRFKTCNPAPALSGAVRELWILEDEGGDAAGLPKPYVEIVISLKGRHLWRATPEGPEHIYDCAWVTPLQSAPRFARSDGWRALVGARLHPLVARAIFAQLPRGDGTPPPHLADLIGEEAASLRQQVLGASSDEDKFACLERWLRRKLDGLPSGNRSYSWGAHHERVAQLAEHMRLSERTVRRRFAAEVGISPKQWLRLCRLERLLRSPHLADRRASLAEMAYELGYYDQAHLTRDVAELTSTTPLRLRHRPAGQPPHFVTRN